MFKIKVDLKLNACSTVNISAKRLAYYKWPWTKAAENRPAGQTFIVIILFVSDTMVHSYIQKHTSTHRHTKNSKTTSKNRRED